MYFHLILSDFKLGQKWLIRSHFNVWKTYFAVVLENYRRREFELRYIIMLLVGLISPHTIALEIGPTMADRWPFYYMENLFGLCTCKLEMIAVVLKIYYTATLLSSFPLYYQIWNQAKIGVFHNFLPLRIYYLNKQQELCTLSVLITM